MAIQRQRQPQEEIRSIKATVRARDCKCVKCGVSNSAYLAAKGHSLDVHRLVPASPYTVEGCVTLCKACHGPEPKSKPGKGDDPHKSNRLVRLPEWLHDLLKEIAAENRREMTDLVRDALVEKFEMMGKKIPPPNLST